MHHFRVARVQGFIVHTEQKDLLEVFLEESFQFIAGLTVHVSLFTPLGCIFLGLKCRGPNDRNPVRSKKFECILNESILLRGIYVRDDVQGVDRL